MNNVLLLYGSLNSKAISLELQLSAFIAKVCIFGLFWAFLGYFRTSKESLRYNMKYKNEKSRF